MNIRTSRFRFAMWACLLGGGAICIAATSTSTVNPNSPPSAKENYNDKYSVVSDRNIFVKDRYRPTRRSEPTSRSATPPLEQSLVLTGIVIEDQGLRAYVENTNTHEVLRLSPGDSVAHGKVESIQIDAFDYDHNGDHMWIGVGNDLTGREAELPSDSYSSGSTTNPSGSSSSSTQPSGPPIDASDPNLSLEQRLKLRRQQLLNGH